MVMLTGVMSFLYIGRQLISLGTKMISFINFKDIKYYLLFSSKLGKESNKMMLNIIPSLMMMVGCCAATRKSMLGCGRVPCAVCQHVSYIITILEIEQSKASGREQR